MIDRPYDWAVEIPAVPGGTRRTGYPMWLSRFLASACLVEFPDQANEAGRLAFVVTHGKDLSGESMLAASVCHATSPPWSISPVMSSTTLWAEDSTMCLKAPQSSSRPAALASSAKTICLSRVVGNAARIRVASTHVLQIRRVQRVVVTSGARGLIVVSRHVLPL